MSTPSIQRIVLTGGPCAGKSTALERVTRWLRGHGVSVYLVQEASTLILSGGVSVTGAPREQMVAFQRGIIQVQFALEGAYLNCARAVGRPAVVLCDRGAMDGAAYLREAEWRAVLEEDNLREADLLARYDAVLHLISTACGAEEHYGMQSNSVRYETLEEARIVDLRLRDAWRAHPRHQVVDNTADFETKLQRVLTAVCALVGAPLP